MSRRTWIAALLVVLAAILGALLGLALTAPPARTAGPPYPSPVTGQRVYDTAGVFSPSVIETAERRIRTIEDRTGAQIVVYTQVKPESDTSELAQADADALGTQWGVGRRGFDDGLVILFDLSARAAHPPARPGSRSGMALARPRQAGPEAGAGASCPARPSPTSAP